MDYGSLIMAGGTTVYGLLEYRRRERMHKDQMDQLRRGIMPVTPLKVPTAASIALTGILAVVLLAASTIMILVVFKNSRYGVPLGFVAGLFLSFMAFLVAMMIRDINELRSLQSTS